MGLPSAARNAFKFSGAAYIFSSLLLAFLPDHRYVQTSMGRFLLEQIIFYMGTLAVFLCWELSHHLHQVSACGYSGRISYVRFVYVNIPFDRCKICANFASSSILWNGSLNP